MSQSGPKEYRVQARDQAGRAIQRYVFASSYWLARKRAKDLMSARNARIASIERKKSYAYRVVRGSRTITGVQSAFSRQEVISALERLGFEVKSVRRSIELRLRAPTSEIVTFIGTTAKLLEQQIPFAEVLRIMATNVRDVNLRAGLKDILQDLKNGIDSKEAFVRQSKIFGEHTAMMLGIASKSQELTSIFRSIAQLVERQADFRKGLASSLILPAVTFLTLIGALGFYVVYLLPEMAEMLAPVSSGMPPFTQATLDASRFFQENFLIIVTPFALTFAGLYAYILSDKGRIAFDRFLIRIPYIGRILRNTSVEIFCRVFAIVYTSSNENINAVRVSAEASGNRFLDYQIKNTAIPLMLKFGTEFGNALEQTKFFPEMVISRFKTSGETGDLQNTAKNVADYYQMENQYAMKNLISIIEVAISMIIMVALVFLTYLSSETAAIKIDPFQR